MVTGIDESKTAEAKFEQQQQEQQLDESCSDDSDAGPAGALSSKFDRTDVSINTNPLPYGKYTLIGIDIDTTGRRLIDEIVQISAYTPEHQYSQYIMPLMNLNPAARQRHQVRVITVGFFRMLKSMQTYRVVKTKTEISALNEFINWLEERYREDEGSEGIVLIYHEQRKFVPYMLIEAVKKYNLLDRFTGLVKSFANGFKLAEEKCTKTIKYFSIRQLAKLVLDESEAKDGFEGNAAYRARLAYQLARRLSKEDDKAPTSDSTQVTAECEEETQSNDEAESEEGAVGGSSAAEDETKSQEPNATVDAENSSSPPSPQCQQNDSDDDRHQTDVDAVTGQVTTVPEPQPRSRPTTEAEREKMCSILCDLASPITCEISELDEQENILARQNSLRPVFLQYFKTTIYHRVKAVTYRRVLAEYGHDFASLQQIWNDSKREGLEAVVSKISELKEEERTELVELLDCHFDPEKQQLKPVVKRTRGRSTRGRMFFGNKSNNMSVNSNDAGGNYNTGNNGKENRKPMHANSRNNSYHNNSGVDMNNSNNQGGGKNNYHNNSNNSQPPSPNGGASGKKFRQRQQRRRRSHPGVRQNAMNQQQQPQMIHANA